MGKPASKAFLKALEKSRKQPLRTKYIDADFRRNPRTQLSCLNCQKDINPRSAYREVFYVDGTMILHPDDVHRKAELLQDGTLDWRPVGPDCAKTIGLEWSRPKGGGRG